MLYVSSWCGCSDLKQHAFSKSVNLQILADQRDKVFDVSVFVINKKIDIKLCLCHKCYIIVLVVTDSFMCYSFVLSWVFYLKLVVSHCVICSQQMFCVLCCRLALHAGIQVPTAVTVSRFSSGVSSECRQVSKRVTSQGFILIISHQDETWVLCTIYNPM